MEKLVRLALLAIGVSLSVSAIAATRSPSVSLSASAQAVPRGGKVSLTWSATNAKSCTASGAWSGIKPVVGTETIANVTQDQTFTLTCKRKRKTSSASQTVSIIPLPAVSISASNEPVRAGSVVTVSWTSTNATSCTASGAWSGAKPTSGAEQVQVSAASTFSLSCNGPGGSAAGNAPVTIIPLPVVNLATSAAEVPAGSTVTLTWSSQYASTCTAAGAWAGAKATSGNETVTVRQGSRFTLTCSGDGGSGQASQIVQVLVPTSLSLSASASEVLVGSSVTLTWSTNGSGCIASGNWGGNKASSGSEVATVTANSIFTLECTGSGGNASRSVAVKTIAYEPFNVVLDRLTRTFTKDAFETTQTYIARVSDEIYQQTTYFARSTDDTYNIISSTYNADLEELTFKFMFTCATGDGGQPCAPDNAIPLAKGDVSGGPKSTFGRMAVLKLQNPPAAYAKGFVLRVKPDVAREIVTGSPHVVVRFRLPLNLPIDASIGEKILTHETLSHTTISGWRYSYYYEGVLAGALEEITLVARTTGKVLGNINMR